MQSKRQSAIESFTNVTVGLILAYLITMYILPHVWDFQPTPQKAAEVTAIYFVVSYIRQYVVRRFFNKMEI